AAVASPLLASGEAVKRGSRQARYQSAHQMAGVAGAAQARAYHRHRPARDIALGEGHVPGLGQPLAKLRQPGSPLFILRRRVYGSYLFMAWSGLSADLVSSNFCPPGNRRTTELCRFLVICSAALPNRLSGMAASSALCAEPSISPRR